ncbi:ABC transporter, ATP-binding protein (cluster 9, phospholipid) [hydrothermal vent metagenome]|uniref:ABC transporter, ATP-binding protein (Cluster 9, phospholipid) n=1 Tax=hydrothermal vent metagenome TaxID=652676 RepID=A0A3B0RYU3_9ZZZZ
MSTQPVPIIAAKGVRNAFGSHVVHDNLQLDVMTGEVLGLVGGSGTGKSVLMNTFLGLRQAQAGEIKVLGVDITKANHRTRIKLSRRWGVLFQNGALFSSLSVRENVKAPMREHADLPEALMNELADLRISLAGLEPEAGAKLPSELSGGMRKRAALARALALDPELLFLDEPTAGLDPIGAAAFDQLILELKQTLGLTVFMVTHDLDSLRTICDRVAVLADQKVEIVAPIRDLLKSTHPWVQEYFHGPRGSIAFGQQVAEKGK